MPNKIQIFNKDGSVTTYSSHDDLQNDYYTELLVDMDEPSLWLRLNTAKRIESYRLLIAPSFGNYICVRIDVDSSENVTVYHKVRSHDYTDENDRDIKGKLITNITKSLSIKKIRPLKKKLADINLWEMKEEDFPIVNPKNNVISTDGEDILIELVSTDGISFLLEHTKDKKYHMIDVPYINYGPIGPEILDQIAQLFIDLDRKH